MKPDCILVQYETVSNQVRYLQKIGISQTQFLEYLEGCQEIYVRHWTEGKFRLTAIFLFKHFLKFSKPSIEQSKLSKCHVVGMYSL